MVGVFFFLVNIKRGKSQVKVNVNTVQIADCRWDRFFFNFGRFLQFALLLNMFELSLHVQCMIGCQNNNDVPFLGTFVALFFFVSFCFYQSAVCVFLVCIICSCSISRFKIQVIFFFLLPTLSVC